MSQNYRYNLINNLNKTVTNINTRMAHNKTEDTSFRDLVARLNSMHNLTPEQERQSLIESVGQAPKVLDDKEVTLADIAKLAGIKEYVEPVKHSKAATKMVESITAPQSSISKAIAESDADDSISKQIKEAVTKESSRLDKIAELETQLADAEVTEKVKDFVDYDRNKEEPHTPEKDGEEEAEDKSDEKDTDGEVDMLDPEFDEGEAVELEAPAEVKFTNDLDPADKK